MVEWTVNKYQMVHMSAMIQFFEVPSNVYGRETVWGCTHLRKCRAYCLEMILFSCFWLLHYAMSLYIYCTGLPCLFCQRTPTFSKASQLLYFEVAVISVWSGFDTTRVPWQAQFWNWKYFWLPSFHIIFEFFVVCWYPYTFSETLLFLVIGVCNVKGFSWHTHKISYRWVCWKWGQKLMFRPWWRVGTRKYI